MTYVLWLLLVSFDGRTEWAPVGFRPLTREECLAIAEYERKRRDLNPWAGKTFVWCDPRDGFPGSRFGRTR